ncbi:hypothetical protein GGX14DRAFT_610233 [Mycena pura]|uniref:Cytochrome P450 n=1 Tax=Mycena pura TaxID=153505 RepID=A0AAD6UKW4_9AGAR|nr:hypothetical protein GGX14DRAFT_610233 [Mycena pura]
MRCVPQWGPIELARDPALQTELRDKLLVSGDPSWEELTGQGFLLDVFACEIMRMHLPLPEIERMAALLLLSAPLETAAGARLVAVFVCKGQWVKLPIECADEFGARTRRCCAPRWRDDGCSVGAHRTRELQGYRRLLTFSNGPHICHGKSFLHLARSLAPLTTACSSHPPARSLARAPNPHPIACPSLALAG